MDFKNATGLTLEIFGKQVKITAIFTDATYYIEYLEANPGEGVIDIVDDCYILIASKSDKG